MRKIQLIILLILFPIIFTGCTEQQTKLIPSEIEENNNKINKINNITNNNPSNKIEKNITQKENNISEINITNKQTNNTQEIENKTIENNNTKENNITTIEENENWYKPKPGTTWQWQLAGEINTEYEVDLYDIDLVETPQSTIDELQNRGVKVICYFSAGSYEEYRSDTELFPKEVLGRTLDGWPDEKWLDVAHYEKFSDIMEKRLDLAVEKNCDGVEPDNMDGYTNNNGFGFTYQDQVRYTKWLADEAHKRNLSIALKNILVQNIDANY